MFLAGVMVFTAALATTQDRDVLAIALTVGVFSYAWWGILDAAAPAPIVVVSRAFHLIGKQAWTRLAPRE